MIDPRSFVIGVDGGGTYTRVLCAALDGSVLAAAQGGGAHPEKNAAAEQNFRQAVELAVARSSRDFGQVVGFVAGLAGIDAPEDQVWAARYTSWPALRVTARCVNDGLVAWAGALALEPGIIAIGGTGSIVFGVTASGAEVSDYDFRAHSGLMARALVRSAVYRVVAGLAGPEDQPLVAQILAHFGAEDVAALAHAVAGMAALPYETFVYTYGEFAPTLTAAAEAGAPLAQVVCDEAAAAMALSVRLVGSRFAAENPALGVPVALIGGVVRSSYLARRVEACLTEATQPCASQPAAYTLVEPALPPEAGAVLMALKQAGVPVDGAVVARLAAHMPSAVPV